MVEIRLSELKAKLDSPAASNSEHHHFPKLLPKINQTLWLQGFQDTPGGGRGGNDRGEVQHHPLEYYQSWARIALTHLHGQTTVWTLAEAHRHCQSSSLGGPTVPALFDGWSDCLPGDETSSMSIGRRWQARRWSRENKCPPPKTTEPGADRKDHLASSHLGGRRAQMSHKMAARLPRPPSPSIRTSVQGSAALLFDNLVTGERRQLSADPTKPKLPG